jgi:hypothetical protein
MLSPQLRKAALAITRELSFAAARRHQGTINTDPPRQITRRCCVQSARFRPDQQTNMHKSTPPRRPVDGWQMLATKPINL